MRKKSKGFFLAETIIVLALVTTAVAFVFPNTIKLYENHVNQSLIYDTVEDIYALKAISKTKWFCDNASNMTKNEEGISWTKNIGYPAPTMPISTVFDDLVLGNNYKLEKLYISSYMSELKSNDYEFNKYLKRLKKTNYDDTSYRIIGIFDNGSNKRYASIKIHNPGPNGCNY